MPAMGADAPDALAFDAAGAVLGERACPQRHVAGMPPAALAYLPGNRSAIDCMLDQHNEKKPKNQIIREKFNTYRFAITRNA
jgi:hypothetical protein